MKKAFSSEELRAYVKASGLTLGELSDELNYSATTLSLWLRDKYPNRSADLEAALAGWINALNLTARDRRKFSYIQDLLDSADNKEALLQHIKKKNRPSSQMPALPIAHGFDGRDGDAVA